MDHGQTTNPNDTHINNKKQPRHKSKIKNPPKSQKN